MDIIAIIVKHEIYTFMASLDTVIDKTEKSTCGNGSGM